MILIGYDGSDDAKAAILEAGTLLPGRATTVLTVWEHLMDVLVRTPGSLGLMGGISDLEELDEVSEKAAARTAQEGVEQARAAGLDASPRVSARSGTLARTILAEADAVAADAIVLGSRGLTGIGSVMGSVSHAVLQHADRAVLVVPSPQVAHERSDKLHTH
jgi:nucleotide-binding universal stress UspA family protein